MDTQMESMTNLSDASFHSAVQTSHDPVLVYMHASCNCGPCEEMGSVVSYLARKYEGHVTFYAFNAEENPQTPGALGVIAVPTLLILKDGGVTQKLVGLRDLSELVRTLDHHLGRDASQEDAASVNIAKRVSCPGCSPLLFLPSHRANSSGEAPAATTGRMPYHIKAATHTTDHVSQPSAFLNPHGPEGVT